MVFQDNFTKKIFKYLNRLSKKYKYVKNVHNNNRILIHSTTFVNFLKNHTPANTEHCLIVPKYCHIKIMTSLVSLLRFFVTKKRGLECFIRLECMISLTKPSCVTLKVARELFKGSFI